MPLLFGDGFRSTTSLGEGRNPFFLQTDRSVGNREMVSLPRFAVKQEVGFPAPESLNAEHSP